MQIESVENRSCDTGLRPVRVAPVNSLSSNFQFSIALFYFVLATLISLPAMARDPHVHPSSDIQSELSTTNVHPGDQPTLAVIVTMHNGMHAQSRTPLETPDGPSYIRFDLAVKNTPDITFGAVQYPPGVIKHFAALGDVSIYEGKVILKIPVTISANAKPAPLKITGELTYQACDDQSCSPPEAPVFVIDTQIVATDQPVAANPAFTSVTLPPVIEASSPTPSSSTDDDSATLFGINLAKTTWPLAFTAAFLIGIIFNLMPCVLPVLPLKIMGFYEVSQHNRAKSVALGAVFSAGLIASFAVLAALVVGTTKLKWGQLFEHTWFTVSIAGVLVVMAISTFGFFTVNVPTALYSFTPRHDTFVGNFLFGILTAALSTPCTFGMFVGLLAWALKQPPWVGGACIMIVGVGMASPYFILSAMPELARKFPRTGPWAEVIKQMMGFLLLATAVYFARPLFQHVLSENVFWWSLFAVLAAGAVFLVIRAIQLSDNTLPRVIASVLAVLIVVPAFYVAHLLTETPFQWIPYTDKALADATASGRPVVIDFTATWCGNCHYIEAFVLHSWRVTDAINTKKVIMLQADVTGDNLQARTLLDQLNPAGSIPVTAVYLPHQDKPKVLNGIYKPADLLNMLGGT